jgi:hypothetical protein
MGRPREQRPEPERGLRARLERARNGQRQSRPFGRAIAGVEEERRRDLIVAAAPGVQQRPCGAGELADPRVDRAVHVLEAAVAGKRHERAVVQLVGDLVERRVKLARRGIVEHPARAQRRDVCLGATQIERREDEVVLERGSERDQRRIGGAGEPAAPL